MQGTAIRTWRARVVTLAVAMFCLVGTSSCRRTSTHVQGADAQAASLPADWPTSIPPYPGAQLTWATTSKDGKDFWAARYSSTDALADIGKHYSTVMGLAGYERAELKGGTSGLRRETRQTYRKGMQAEVIVNIQERTVDDPSRIFVSITQYR